MGKPLVDLLSTRGHTVYVTTRSTKQALNGVRYVCGNAKDFSFLKSVLNTHYDAIIDFMVYNTEEFRERYSLLLDHTDQYFYFSSARCYAQSECAIVEDSPRLIDVCKDQAYLATDEYGLSKGKEENILFHCGRKNWTIIRPYITYNDYRIQLGVYEKENWLRRALAGRTIVFPKDIANCKTSLTYAPDVAGAILDLIGNKKAYGEAFHITTDESHTWGEILEFYCKKIGEITGHTPKVLWVDSSAELQKVWNPWQIKYDRLYNRTFDNQKIESVRGKYEFMPCFEGLGNCLEVFINNPQWRGVNARYEAWCDAQTGEITPLREIPGKKAKLEYIVSRIFRIY